MKWRPIKTNRRCCALDNDGKRCTRRATWVGPLFADLEAHEPDVYWVRVELCGLHAGLRDTREETPDAKS